MVGDDDDERSVVCPFAVQSGQESPNDCVRVTDLKEVTLIPLVNEALVCAPTVPLVGGTVDELGLAILASRRQVTPWCVRKQDMEDATFQLSPARDPSDEPIHRVIGWLGSSRQDPVDIVDIPCSE